MLNVVLRSLIRSLWYTHLTSLLGMGTSASVFEIKATVADKLEWFLTDTLPASKDSVIGLINNYSAYISDADLQLVFAYMNKGDYTHAETKTNALGTSRTDWKNLLLTLIEIYQEPENIFSVATNTAYKSFLQGYANTDGKDGQGIAQAILKFACDIDYTEPRPIAEEDVMERRMQDQLTAVNTISGAINEITVFPNPAQNLVTIRYANKDETPVTLELKDLLGKTIYTNFISVGKEEQISLQGYNNGIYILSLSRSKELIYTKKLVKQE